MKMKIGRYEVELAKQSAPKSDGKEQGSADSGFTSSQYFGNESGLGGVRNPSIKNIMDMIDNDGTAAMLYNVMAFPIMASAWHIEHDPADVLETTDANGNKITTHPQADFIDSCLRNPEHKGGMSTPFSNIVANMCLAIAQGHRFFEIVYKVNAEGQIVFKKVAPREHGSYTIKKDDTGGFGGVEQSVKKDGKTQKVLIDLPYCFLYTYRKERKPLEGMTAFRAAFYHYDKKHRLYYLQNQQGQVTAIPLKTLEQPDADVDPKVRDANLAAVDKMAVRPSIALPFGWKLTVHDLKPGIDLSKYVDGHDVQMARSVLAQGQLLGNQTASTGGSYALSESHWDSFMLGEQAVMQSMEEHITAFLISKLIDYNFENPLYPEFKFNALDDTATALLQEAFKSLVTKGTVPQWVSDGISKKVAEQMEIEEPEDTSTTNDNTGNGTGTGDAPAADAPADTTVQNSRPKGNATLAKGSSEWWRELTAPEAKVQFSAIKKQADKAEDKLVKDMKPVFDKISADTTKRLKPLLEEKGAKALDGFTLKFDNELRDVMNTAMVDMYGTAKTNAADELKLNAPANKKKSKDLMGEHVKAIVDKQFSDLLFEIKTTVTDAIRKNLMDKTELSVGEVLALISGIFSLFYDDKETLTASSLITTAINIGRDDVFQEYGNKIYGYQYSAILDEVVCAVCEDLDSSVVDEATYYSTKWMPPIHFNCRCIWVAIMNDEEDKPDFTGLPDAPGGTTEPSLSHSHEMVTLGKAGK